MAKQADFWRQTQRGTARERVREGAKKTAREKNMEKMNPQNKLKFMTKTALNIHTVRAQRVRIAY